MNKEVVSYDQAVALKEIGFDEQCYGFYTTRGFYFNNFTELNTTYSCNAPLKQQAFRWFREKYKICLVIKPISSVDLSLGYNLIVNELIYKTYTTYEKAEEACIDKLIELVKNKQL